MTDTKDVARTWLEGLAARGIATRLVNGRIRHWPASAWTSLTEAEKQTFRTHRQAIKDAINAGFRPQVMPPFSVVDRRRVRPDGVESLEASPPPPVEPCPYCMQTPCVGETHDAYCVLHVNDPAEITRRQDALAEEFWLQMARADWPLALAWARRSL